MSYQYNNISNRTSIRINNPRVSVRGNLVSVKQIKKQEEELLNNRISKKYKKNLVLVFVITITIMIVVGGVVIFSNYN